MASRYSRRIFLRNAALGAAGMSALGCGGDATDKTTAPQGGASPAPAIKSTDARKPNIVLIVLDTLRADKMGCYGYPGEVSPAFDRLAGEGVLMERAISQGSWTRPSIASFLTSKFPRTLGIYKEQNEMLPGHFETLPKLLKQGGYRTLGNTANPNINSRYNFQHGFDTYIDSNVIFGWMEQEENAKLRGQETHLPTAPNMFDRMMEMVKDGDESTPTYIQVNAMEVHEWYMRLTMIRPEYRQMFLDSGETYPKYLQSTRQLTDDIGAFVDTITALPGWEDTWFVLLSDHGEGLDSHPDVQNSRYHGWLLYESQVVVPWVMYNPARPQPVKRITQPVRLLELLPTVLDLAGLPIPADIEGKSIAPVMRGEAESVVLPRYLVTETDWRRAEKVAAYDTELKFFLNKSRQPAGVPPQEMQQKGTAENGRATNVLAEYPEEAQAMLAYLKQWERDYPKAPPVAPTQEMSQQEREQLEAIGYLGTELGEPD